MTDYAALGRQAAKEAAVEEHREVILIAKRRDVKRGMRRKDEGAEVMPTYIGIDPGKSGAIAVIWTDGHVSLHDLNGSPHDTWQTLAEITSTAMLEAKGEPIYAALERVGTRPGEGAVGAFTFGVGWGELRMALIALGVTYCEPTPQTWKRRYWPTKAANPQEQKQRSRDKARQLYPSVASQLTRVKDADRAEALLLADYCKGERRC